MCLQIAKNIHPQSSDVSRCVNSRVASYDILCYKRLIPSTKKAGLSPYQKYVWWYGETVTSSFNIVKGSGLRSYFIYDGLHAYTTRIAAFNCADGWEHIHPAIIPKGSRFFIGESGDIVADTMTVYATMDDALQGRTLQPANLAGHEHQVVDIYD